MKITGGQVRQAARLNIASDTTDKSSGIEDRKTASASSSARNSAVEPLPSAGGAHRRELIMLLKRFDRLCIQQKMLVGNGSLLVLTAIFIILLFPWATGYLLQRSLGEQATSLAGLLARSAAAGVATGDQAAIEAELDPILGAAQPNLLLILDADGRPLARHSAGDAGEAAALVAVSTAGGHVQGPQKVGGTLSAAAPILHEDRSIGLAVVGLPTAGLYKATAWLRWLALGFSVCGLATGLVLFYLITRRIVGPLRELEGVARRVAAGEIDLHVQVQGEDEVGQLARTFELMLGNIRSSMRELEQQREDLHCSVEMLLERMERFAAGDLTVTAVSADEGSIGRLCRGFSGAVDHLRQLMGSLVAEGEELEAASGQLSGIAGELLGAADRGSQHATGLAGSARTVDDNIQSVAGATEEMSASIREIAQHSGEAAGVATQAVARANTAAEAVRRLGSSINEIGEVVQVISAIAEQTNLLALNATIEAARAGEAGKGFAVVAGEVKELATETAAATERIAARIAAIQGDGGRAVQAIDEITGVIARINEIQTSIASAVEEQAATTSEIGQSLSVAAGGSSEIASGAAALLQSAEATRQGAVDTRRSADGLADLAGQLLQAVRRFSL
jgi:methyl-accepting chemotaxis protein